MPIVCAKPGSPSCRYAANELADYLGRLTGARGVVGKCVFGGVLLNRVDAADPAVATFPDGKTYFACVRRQGAANERGIWFYELKRPTSLSQSKAQLVKAGRDGSCPKAPAFLVHGRQVFLAYTSAAANEHDSKIMLLTLSDSNPMRPASWKAAKSPLLSSGALVPGKDASRRIDGVRNLSFFTADAGKETWCVYQGVESPRTPVLDKNLLTCLQRIEFEDGEASAAGGSTPELNLLPEVNIELLQPDVSALVTSKAPTMSKKPR